MSKTSKFPGMGRVGDTASGGSKVNGSNDGLYNESRDTGARGPSAPKVASRGKAAEGCSSHNDIGAFTRGIKSRGPYGGPSFESMNHYEHNYKRATPSSNGPRPSAGGR